MEATTSFGRSNSGFQMNANYGTVTNYFHMSPEGSDKSGKTSQFTGFSNSARNVNRSQVVPCLAEERTDIMEPFGDKGEVGLARVLSPSIQDLNGGIRPTPESTLHWASRHIRPAISQPAALDYYGASSECGKGCICKCHSPLRLHLAPLWGLLGDLRITMSRPSSKKVECTEKTCLRRSAVVSRAMVRPPAFILRRMIYLAVRVNPYGSFDMSLKTLRIVPDNADIMQFAKSGRLEDVRSLINKSLASPTDVNDSWGVPVLSYAVQGLHLDLCEFLIRMGAVSSVENRSGVSALDRAWDIYLSRNCDIRTEQRLCSTFSLWYDSLWFEDQQFTSLHKIVLGAVKNDLKAQLQLSTSNIDQQDSKGRTPIAWAAARGDETCVRILLSFGADPEISCDTGNNPLLRSVRAKSIECVKLLLEHGANVQARSVLGFTALHYAAYYQDDEAYLKTLLDYGAQIDEKDSYGWTPLSCTAEYDHMRCAGILLEYGASPNLPDKSGWSPIMRAISSNSHRVLRLLLDKGADYCSLSFRLQTVLHFAAAYGDVDTILLLTDTKMRGITTDTKDVNGHTAAEIFLSRDVCSSYELANAFTNLLTSVDDLSPYTSLL